MRRLRHQIAERSAQRPGHNVDQPEAKYRIEIEEKVADAERDDDHPEQDAGRQITQCELLGHQIAGRGAEREGEQNGEPIERFAPAGEYGVDRKRAFCLEPQ